MSSDSGDNIPGRIYLYKGAAFEIHGEQEVFAVRDLGYPIGDRNNICLRLRQ